MAKRVLKAYQVEVHFRYGHGTAVVAAYGPKAAANLVEAYCKSHHRRDFERIFSSTLLTTLAPTVTKPEILVWAYHIE